MDAFKTVVLSALIGALVSLVVDALKARSAGRWWEAQERWKLKRDTYLRLLDGLWEVTDAFKTQLTLEALEDPKDAAHRREELQRRHALAMKELYKSRGALPLLLRSQTLTVLDKLDSADAIDCPMPYLEAVRNVYTDVLESAREDLQLRLR
jgi:hypothetical protein